VNEGLKHQYTISSLWYMWMFRLIHW